MLVKILPPVINLPCPAAVHGTLLTTLARVGIAWNSLTLYHQSFKYSQSDGWKIRLQYYLYFFYYLCV